MIVFLIYVWYFYRWSWIFEDWKCLWIFDVLILPEMKSPNSSKRYWYVLFLLYLYHLFYIITNRVGKCSKIYLFGFVLLKWPILAADSAVKAGTQLIKMAENVFSPGISQPKYYGFVRYILKWWGFAPIWFRIQLLCASCWRYEIDLLILFRYELPAWIAIHMTFWCSYFYPLKVYRFSFFR